MITERKKKKFNPMLMQVLLISGGLHLAALLVLGSITVYKYIIPDEAQFEEPPAVQEETPPPEVKVEIRPQAPQQQSAMQNLTMRQVGNIAVANVNVDLPTMEQSFTVSSGLGGFGGGALLGGTRGSIGIGISDISVFGLKTRAERVLFVIDASRTMLTDAKGGLRSYKIIKDEVTDMVSNLSAGTLFNVVFYDDGRFLFFKPRPVPAGSEVTAELAKWIAPINANASKLGLPGAQRVALTAMADHPIQKEIPKFQRDGGNENAYLSQVFLEQSIDAIFIITGRHGGFQRIRRDPNERENEEWARRIARPDYQRQLAAYGAEVPEARRKAQEALAKLQAERKKKGLPPKIFDGGLLTSHMGIQMKNRHPGRRPAYRIDKDDVERYFRDFLKEMYDAKGTPSPSINIVLFLAGNEQFSDAQEDNLKDYTRFFDGRYRIIRGLDEIQDARSAQSTVN